MVIINNDVQETLNRILFLKNEKKINDADFERCLGLKQRTIAEWKRGKSKSFTQILFKIADVLEVPVEALRGGLPSSSPDSAQTHNSLSKRALDTFSQLQEEEAALVLKYAQNLIAARPKGE